MREVTVKLEQLSEKLSHVLEDQEERYLELSDLAFI